MYPSAIRITTAAIPMKIFLLLPEVDTSFSPNAANDGTWLTVVELADAETEVAGDAPDDALAGCAEAM
jgi:hypothetical protein